MRHSIIDDFQAIRARMDEIRRERSSIPAKPIDLASRPRVISVHHTTKRAVEIVMAQKRRIQSR